jgi:hypothetical protein
VSDDIEHVKLQSQIEKHRLEIDAQMGLDRAKSIHKSRFLEQTMKSMGEKIFVNSARHDVSEKDIVCLKKKVFRIFATFIAIGTVLTFLAFVITKFKEIKEFIQFSGLGG